MIHFNGISIMVYFFKDNFGKDVSKQALLTKLPVSLPFFFCLLFFTFVVFICCICFNFYHHVMFNISCFYFWCFRWRCSWITLQVAVYVLSLQMYLRPRWSKDGEFFIQDWVSCTCSFICETLKNQKEKFNEKYPECFCLNQTYNMHQYLNVVDVRFF